MYRVLFYEPKKEFHGLYKNLFKQIEEKNDIKLTVLFLTSALDLKTFLTSKDNYPDFLFIHVLLDDDSSGINFAVSLRSDSYEGQIVFIAPNLNAVLDSFKAYPLYYLIENDISSNIFFEVFDLGLNALKSKIEDSFFVNIRGKAISVKYSDITYFRSDKRLVEIHKTDDEIISFYANFSDIARRINHKGFLRVHRSYIVNHAYIEEANSKTIRLVGDITIPVGASYFANLKDTLLIPTNAK